MGKRASESELRSSDDRDQSQRSLGLVGLSAIAHVGLLVAILLAPSFKAERGEVAGSAPGAAAAPSAPSDATGVQAPSEVLLADADDTTAVAMPTEAKPVEVSQPVTTPPKPVAKIAAKAPVAKKSAAPKATNAESDVAIDNALNDSRQPKEKDDALADASAEAPAAESSEIAAATAVAPTAEAPVEAQADSPAEEPTEPKAAPVAEDSTKTTTSAATTSVAAQDATPTNSAATSGSATAPTVSPSSQANGAGLVANAAGADAQAPASSAGGARGFSLPLGVPVRDANTLIAMPGNPSPVYPMPDRLTHHEGTAVLIANVKADGTIGNIVIEKSSGSRLMDESAATAYKKWRYQPGQAGLARKPFKFALVGDAKELPAQLQRQ